MKRGYVSLLIAGMLVIVGCGGFAPFSKEPMTNFDPNAIDTRLLGTWFWLPEDLPESLLENLPENTDISERVFLHIGYAEESPFLKVICVWMDDDESGYLDFEGFPSSFEGNTYLNLKWLNPIPALPEEIRAEYIIVKYHWKTDRLGIALPSGAFIWEAIEEGRLRGTIVGKTFDQAIQEGHGLNEAMAETLKVHVRITASQKELQAFLQKYDKDVFDEYMYLHKFQYQNIRENQDN